MTPDVACRTLDVQLTVLRVLAVLLPPPRRGRRRFSPAERAAAQARQAAQAREFYRSRHDHRVRMETPVVPEPSDPVRYGWPASIEPAVRQACTQAFVDRLWQEEPAEPRQVCDDCGQWRPFLLAPSGAILCRPCLGRRERALQHSDDPMEREHARAYRRQRDRRLRHRRHERNEGNLPAWVLRHPDRRDDPC